MLDARILNIFSWLFSKQISYSSHRKVLLSCVLLGLASVCRKNSADAFYRIEFTLIGMRFVTLQYTKASIWEGNASICLSGNFIGFVISFFEKLELLSALSAFYTVCFIEILMTFLYPYLNKGWDAWCKISMMITGHMTLPAKMKMMTRKISAAVHTTAAAAVWRQRCLQRLLSWQSSFGRSINDKSGSGCSHFKFVHVLLDLPWNSGFVSHVSFYLELPWFFYFFLKYTIYSMQKVAHAPYFVYNIIYEIRGPSANCKIYMGVVRIIKTLMKGSAYNRYGFSYRDPCINR